MVQLTDAQRAALELEKHRRRLRADFPYFATHAIKLANPAYVPAASHIVLCQYLQRLHEKEFDKLMVFCPSGWGKSTYLSHYYSCWKLANTPGLQLIGASHKAEFAENKISRPIQNLMREMRADLKCEPIDDNKAEWRTSNGSSYRATGVGAGILGERAHLGIIDDPFGKIADAKSAKGRDAVYDWYRGDFTSRLHLGNSQQVLMHQRVHLDDLAGRLMDEEGETWEILHLPARFEGLDWRGNKIESDVLGRTRIGESIWPERWTEPLLEEREKAAGAYAWASMYQQRPQPVGGTVFYADRLTVVETEADLLPAKRILMTFDYGASRKGDYSVGVLMQENGASGGWTILDLVRKQTTPDQLDRLIVEFAAKAAEKYGRDGFKIFLPQDPAAAGAHMVASFTKLLAGYDTDFGREGGDKETRAAPFASQVNAGNISMLAGPWNRAFKQELEDFPGGKNDDQVDAAATAFAHLIPEPEYVAEPIWSHTPVMAR